MLKLDEALLDQALQAVVNHGYGDFFPEPTELGIVIANWNVLRPCLADFDLDTYAGYDHITTFAPNDEAAFYEDLDESQKKEVDALNLSEMLKKALAEGHHVGDAQQL